MSFLAQGQKKICRQALKVWHDRMGHLSYDGLIKLARHSSGMDLTKDIPPSCECEFCLLTNMTKKPHSSPIQPGRAPWDFVYSDVVTINDYGFDGSKYFVTFVCDRTKSARVYFMKSKGEVTDWFIHFKKSVERPGCSIHRLRDDNGGEYIAGRFQQFLKSEGILWELTVPYTPQQNGASERFGRTIWVKAKAMLRAANLPMEYWPEAVRYAVYLYERSVHRTIGITPFEAMNHSEPDLSHIRKFGSKLYNTVGKSAKKLEDKAYAGKLLGFDGDRIYRILKEDGKVARGHGCHVVETEPSRESESEPQITPPQPSPAVTLSAPTQKILQIRSLAHKTQPQKRKAEDFFNLEEPPVKAPKVTYVPPARPTPSSHPNLHFDNIPPYNPEYATSELTSPGTEPADPFDADTIVVDAGPEMNRAESSDPLALILSAEDSISLLSLLMARSDGRLKCTGDVVEPKTLAEAQAQPEWPQWEAAMKEEYDSLIENKVWETVESVPTSRSPLPGKWVFRLKPGAKGEILRYKARWVCGGHRQREGIDFHETFASVVKPMSYKAIFALAAALDWEIEQMDVKTAFLYGVIDDVDLFMTLPTGVGVSGNCRLKKALYGLKQSPRVWYNTLATFLQTLGFKPLDSDTSVFCRDGLIMAIYVDDMLIVGKDEQEIQEVKDALSQRFHMTDLKACHFYLGMEVTRDRPARKLRLCQEAYVRKILSDNGMRDCKPIAVPMAPGTKLQKSDDAFQQNAITIKAYQSMVGSLMYAMLGTRPDIAYAVSCVSRYASNPSDQHIVAVKKIFQYLQGTAHFGLEFTGTLEDLKGFTDADWAGCEDTRRSTSGYVFNLGSAAISWSSKRQATVSLSTCEAELIGQTQATKEAIWLRRFLSHVNPNADLDQATVIFGDNQGAIALAKNPQFHARTKHVAIQDYFVREKVATGEIEMRFVPTQEQIADGLTKPLPKVTFEAFRAAVGVMPIFNSILLSV